MTVNPQNLLGIPETLLPQSHPDTEVAAALGTEESPAVAREQAALHPASSLAWAVLAEDALAGEDPIAAYAYARVGYHRGLDALRRSGWRGQGPVPYRHPQNRGFLRALAALGRAAAAINEEEEVTRIAAFLHDCDAAYAQENPLG
ncbi:DUF3151 domain-containing protein [Dermabacteraceae bacterium P7054]